MYFIEGGGVILKVDVHRGGGGGPIRLRVYDLRCF